MVLTALLLAVSVAAQVQLDPTVNYTVTLAEGKVSGCDPLKDMLSNRGCGTDNLQDLWNVDDGSGNQHYRFVPVPGSTDTFNVITACQKYLSCQPCNGDSTVDLFGDDDGSGRQRWLLTAVSGEANTYTFQVAGGRDASCGIFMSTGDQCNDTYVDLFTSDDGSGRQRWVLDALQASSDGSSSSSSSSSSASSSSSPPLTSLGSSSSSSSSNSSSSSSSNSSGSSSSSSSGSASVTSGLSSVNSGSSISSFPTSPPSSPASSGSPNSNSNSDSSSSSSNSSSKTNVGAIAGGVVGGILLLLLFAGTFFFVNRRKRDSDYEPANVNPIPYMPAPQTTELGATSQTVITSGTSNSTSSRAVEKGRSRRTSVAATVHSGGSTEAAELRNEVDNLRREMAQIRTQRQYDMQPPPLYGQA